MCGIAGVFDLRGRRPVDAGLLARMSGRLAHRGPDGDGTFIAPGVGLAHRRLAIVDLAGGAQPLFNEDGGVAVVFNGEIYNFRDLHRELEALGHRFATRSDTEVIVHAWEEWGEACVERFRGMFAFALWDRNHDTLFLARDRLGIKPLHYAVLPDGMLLFASELKALLVHPGLSRDIDPCAVEDYLALGYVPDPRTIYRGAAKLAPGHRLCTGRGNAAPTPRRWWNLQSAEPLALGVADAAGELAERLEESVRLHMLADVPLGAFLSGGIDSGAVVATMAGLSAAPVATCSIGFTDPAFDETAYAAAVARRFGTEHHVRTVDIAAFSLIDRLAGTYDEPFADSSALPTWSVCALAREHVKVALSGDGGDETFWGYHRYRWHADEVRLRRWLPGPVLRALAGAAPGGRVGATLAALARDPAEGYVHTISVIDETVRRTLYSAAFRRELQGHRAFDTLHAHYAAAPTDHPVGKVQYADLMTYLPGDILTKVDRVSMDVGLEVRVPLLDHPLVEWAHRLPPTLKLNGGEGKAVLKRAMAERLPAEILHRRKAGFAVPLGGWFRGPLAERVREVLCGPTLAATGLFEPAALVRLAERHRSGAADHGPALWALLMLDAFLRTVHAEIPQERHREVERG